MPSDLRHHTFFALAALAATTAFSQAVNSSPRAGAPAPDEEVLKLDAVTVTGSNIKRLEIEKALPVSVMNQQMIELRDASTPVELMIAMPQVVNVPLNETATLGATARGDNSSVSLRGLGTGNTLVLLNNRRMAPHPISAAEGSVPALSVNVNQMPNRGIERIEVLRDGASSIYGTDAVAGVINYISDRNYRGTELRVRYGYNDQAGGDEARATVLFGRSFADGKGRFMTTFDVMKREAVLTRDRSFSAEIDHTGRAPQPWNDYASDTDFFFRSSGSAYGNFTVGTLGSSGAFTGTRPTGVPTALTSSTGLFYLVPATTASGVAFKTSTPSRLGIERDYYYNFGADRAIQPKSTRMNWFASGEYDLGSRMTAFLDLSYYYADSETYREADSASASTDGDIIIPATNPWNPFGTRFFHPQGTPNADGTPRLAGTPSPVRIQNKRFMDFGTRKPVVTSDSFRAVAGLRGKLGETWTWETAGLFTRATSEDKEYGTIRQSLFVKALNQTDANLAYNPFGYEFAVQNGTIAVTKPYANARSIIDTFQQPFLREGETSIASWDLRLSGEVAKFWGNTIAGAVGAEFRHETYDDTRPPYAGLNPAGSGLDPLDNDFLAFSPNSDTHADRDVTAAYAELVVPLVGKQRRLPLVQTFEVSASARYEKYSDFGDTTKPKFGFTWRPLDWMLLRGSVSQGFRAPNLAQLFTGELVRSTGQSDPYRGNVTLLPSDGSVNRLFRRSGNENLRPEEARGRSAGVVIEVPMIKGLSLSIDYWEIRQTGVIGVSNGVTEDNLALQDATQRLLAAGTPIGSIDLGSGTESYLGDPAVVRKPVTQQDRDFFAAYNATRPASQQRAAVGPIDHIKETYFNRSEQFVNGVDLEATWRLPRTPIGQFTLNTEWTYNIDWHLYDVPGAARDDRRWQAGAPIWKGTTGVSWKQGNWRAGLSALYIGSFQDSDGGTTATVFNNLGQPDYIAETFDTGAWRYRYLVSSTTTLNAYVGYRVKGKNNWLEGTNIRLGVLNLTRKDPPLAVDSRGYSTTVYNSLARGRVWSLELSREF